MMRIIFFMVVVYFFSILGGWVLTSKNAQTNAQISKELASVKNELAGARTNLATEKTAREALEKKIAEAQNNAKFLSFSLCPLLELSDKNAFCVKNKTEWFSQMMVSGTGITDPATKEKMDALLISMGGTKKPTAKELYELLKPVTLSSVKAIEENLK